MTSLRIIIGLVALIAASTASAQFVNVLPYVAKPNYTFILPAAQGANTQTLLNDGAGNLSWGSAGSGGSVTSVAMTVPPFLSVAGSPITTAGTLAVTLSGTALPVVDGGTGATSAGAALTSLGAYPIAGGNITGAVGIGSATPVGDLDVALAYTVATAIDGAVRIHPVLTAHANNDTPYGLYSSPTCASGGHSGTICGGAYFKGNSGVALALDSDGNYGVLAEFYSQGSEAFRIMADGQILADGSGSSSAAQPIYGSLQDSHSGMYISGSTVLFSTASTERARITNTGLGIGVTPTAKLDVAGTVKLGTAGIAFTAAGACTVGSSTPSTTPANVTCTGVPASTAVAVTCSGTAAFSTAAGDAIYARATGTADTIAVNTVVANVTAMTLSCMWIQP